MCIGWPAVAVKQWPAVAAKHLEHWSRRISCHAMQSRSSTATAQLHQPVVMTCSCGQLQPMAGEAAAGPSREHVSVCKYVIMAARVDSVFVCASVHKTHDGQWILTNTPWAHFCTDLLFKKQLCGSRGPHFWFLFSNKHPC